MAAKPGGHAPRVKLDVLKMKDKTTPDGNCWSCASVKPGQRIQLNMSNDSNEDLWVTVLFLDANAAMTPPS